MIRPARTLLLGLLAVVAYAPTPALAAPPPTPTVTATPSTGLVDGQVIAAHGDGFDELRFGYVLFQQCAAGATRRGCHISDVAADPVQGPGGTVDQDLRVQAVFRGEDGVEVDCRVAPGMCVVRAVTEAGTDAVDAPLTFDPGAALEPPPTVTVTPDTDLVDGQVVRVEVDGFTPSEWVRVKLCDGPSPFDRCFEGSALAADVGSDSTGHVETDVRLRTIVHPGVRYESSTPEAAPPFDCRQVACFLVVTEEVPGNSDGAAALGYDPDAPVAPEARLTATPTTGLRDGQTVSFAVSGLFAGERFVIGQCAPDALVREICGDEQDLRADADGTGHGRLTVHTTYTHGVFDDPPVDCFATPCELWLWQYDDDDGPDATLALSFADGPTSPATPIAATPAFTG
ncbi:MAG: hypothetical protein JNK12_23315 [Acidimicrobiales bacterium]|nr:hypothetical protein [Acidimicrobiales bacterium]